MASWGLHSALFSGKCLHVVKPHVFNLSLQFTSSLAFFRIDEDVNRMIRVARHGYLQCARLATMGVFSWLFGTFKSMKRTLKRVAPVVSGELQTVTYNGDIIE